MGNHKWIFNRYFVSPTQQHLLVNLFLIFNIVYTIVYTTDCSITWFTFTYFLFIYFSDHLELDAQISAPNLPSRAP